KVREKRNSQLESYQSFLSTSKQCVEKMMNGFQQKNLSTIQSALRENRELLNQLSRYTGVLIETPALSDLCSIAERIGGAAKSSGAGGGDCGIALFDTAVDLTPLYQEWEKEQIEALPLTVFTKQKNN